ncbi:peroxin 22-like protein [Purpureocillium lavendulum]|uniref:Peroxin 22-like protein n=1 Tax=Purpureocillium lavendulum TaxID=1247861 RepID=A0AB34FKL8_9HYPO|nr:peroxin 22-like protein [Purpureocillium lavendulum]
MSSPFDRPDRGSSRRGVWSHWVPLAVTVTVATVGLAAWVWSQRKDDEDGRDDAADHEPDLDYENADYGDNPPYGATGRDRVADPRPPRRGDDESVGVGPGPGPGPGSHLAPVDPSAAGWGARMSGALRRTPSPQQFLDSTGKTVAAGVAAAGAAMGKALASIREEDKHYGENPWSEEADAKKDRAGPVSGKRRKTVAIVVSADTNVSAADDHEIASILSHIPRHNDFSKIKLYILIYAPDLKDTTLETATSNLPPPSLSSSFSNIGHDQAQTPGEETKSPLAAATNNAAFNAVYSQALTLVDKEPMILPFTTPSGHVHILRHVQPEVVYLQESLAGDNGSIITNLQTWLRHDVILVVGAESGSGGLADSESEAEKSGKEEKWWQRPERVGRGRGVVVVDGMRVHDDWTRRVQGRE